MTRIVLLGAGGWLGLAIHRELRRLGPVQTVSRDDLIPGSVESLVDILGPTPELIVVNAAGRLQGTPEELERDNIELPLTLITALRGTGAHLLHVGSPAEYGDPGSPEPISESHPLRPLTDYGRSKAMASAAVLAEPTWCVLRPFNVIDSDMVAINPLAIIRAQIEATKAQGPTIDLPAAEAVRDHVSRAFVAESVRYAVQERIRGAFNVCSGVGLTYRTIAEALAMSLGLSVEVNDLDRPGIRTVVGDPSAWRRAAGMSEAMTVDGVARLVLGEPIGSRE